MLPQAWKPVDSSGLILVGGPGDGAYVVAREAVEQADLLISMGLSDDWSFEEGFLRLGPARVVCFDGTVGLRFWMKRTLQALIRGKLSQTLKFPRYRAFFARAACEHRQLMIGYDGPGAVSLATVLKEFPDAAIFIKMDIEGSEYRILDQIVAIKDRLTGLAIEFHDIDLHRARIDAFLSGMDGFTVVGLHPNNYGGTDANGDPLVIEMAIAADRFVHRDGAAPAPVQPSNNPALPDIVLRYQ